MDMGKMMRDLQKMQSKMLKAQNDLKAQSFDAEAGGGMVKVALNGQGVLTMIKINPEVVDKDDVEALEDLIMAAFNAAVKKKDDATKSSISDITGGMKIPGLM
ncbi:MAG: YbaB/EbfC family nucleoid-associated protein [Fibrobacteraceae bacterium]|nr:YbaB/EbfC family nucleoid-associated protein [Fibrobacteraceae bacterium]